MANDNEKLEVQAADTEVEELDDELLAEAAGGSLRDRVFVNKTTDISDSTRSKI